MKQSILLGNIVFWLCSTQVYGQDCNANSIPDADEIAAGTVQDCNINGIPDSCDLAANQPLVAGQSIPVGAAPQSLTTADMDGNGTPDLIMVNRTSNTVTILLNNGAGSFQASTVAVGTNPESVVAKDFNSDGKPDIAVANSGSNNVSVLLNTGLDLNGNILFGPVQNISVGSFPIFIVATDLNGDGDIDLATANAVSNNVTILFNNGVGVFTAQIPEPVGLTPVALVAADFDGDGIADLAVANADSDSIEIILSGVTTPPQIPTNFEQPFSLTAADFDGDGDNDLIVANSGASIQLMRNDGTGSLTPAGELTRAVNPVFVLSIDFDGDGDFDLIAVDADEVLVFSNTGNGEFVFINAGPGASINSIVVANLNGTAGLDIAAADENVNSILVLQDQVPTAQDCDDNGVPDECQPDTDADGTIDACEDAPAAPQCGAGACGAGAATMAPLMLMGMGWMRPRVRRRDIRR